MVVSTLSTGPLTVGERVNNEAARRGRVLGVYASGCKGLYHWNELPFLYQGERNAAVELIESYG